MSSLHHNSYRSRFTQDRSGAIEGLPLYLIIIIVITVIGLAVVIGMMNAVQPPKTIKEVVVTPENIEAKDPNGDSTYNNTNFALTVKVVDSNNDPVKGALVRLTGCNIKSATGYTYGTTDSNGEVKFTGLSCEVVGKDTGRIQVEVEKNGLGKKTAIVTVVPV